MNSVCVATYNGEKYIEQQLRSILEQIAPTDEVIVSDDSSTDNTIKIVDSIRDKRIHIRHSKAHYFKDNFIEALREAKGDVIFLSDQDDVWLPGKYEHCLKELEDVDLVCTNSKMTDEDLNIIEPNFFSIYHSGLQKRYEQYILRFMCGIQTLTTQSRSTNAANTRNRPRYMARIGSRDDRKSALHRYAIPTISPT